jgi:uncharacterized protein YutE (UPF0331/DUF86 family)
MTQHVHKVGIKPLNSLPISLTKPLDSVKQTNVAPIASVETKKLIDTLQNQGIKEEKASGLDSSYIRLEFPSKGIPYPVGTTFFVRKLMLGDIGLMNNALRYKNMSALLDGLESTIKIKHNDGELTVRDLCLPDFQYLCFYHYNESYSERSRGRIITFPSVYGANPDTEDGRFTSTTSHNRLEEEPIKIKREKLEEWRERGFDYARMRDIEATDFLQDLSDSQKYYLFLAQSLYSKHPDIEKFIDKNSDMPILQAKIQYLLESNLPLSFAEEMQEFQLESSFGVGERAIVRIDKIPKQAAANVRELLQDKTLSEKERKELMRHLNNVLVAGEPMEEELPLKFNQWTLFPIL